MQGQPTGNNATKVGKDKTKVLAAKLGGPSLKSWMRDGAVRYRSGIRHNVSDRRTLYRS
jgi:hypothetical protein